MSNRTLAYGLIESMDAMDVTRTGASPPSQRIATQHYFRRAFRLTAACMSLLALVVAVAAAI